MVILNFVKNTAVVVAIKSHAKDMEKVEAEAENVNDTVIMIMGEQISLILRTKLRRNQKMVCILTQVIILNFTVVTETIAILHHLLINIKLKTIVCQLMLLIIPKILLLSE